MRMTMRGLGGIGGVLFIGVGASLLVAKPVSAQGKFREEVERLRSSAALIETLVAASDTGAFKKLIVKAEAVGVFPVVKEETAIFLESANGDGVISARVADGWTEPAFYQIGSVRYRGIFVTGGKYGIIILFMKRDMMPTCGKENILLRSKMSTKPGPIVSRPDAPEGELNVAVIVAWAYSGGKFLAAPPKRKDWAEFTLNDQDRLNKRLYGVKTCDVLAGKRPEKSPAWTDEFRDRLREKFPAVRSARSRDLPARF